MGLFAQPFWFSVSVFKGHPISQPWHSTPLSGPNNKEAQGPEMLKTTAFPVFLQETANGLKHRREHASNWRP